jgi:hypothetical protein
MNYGQKKISRNYLGESINEQLRREGNLQRRNFDGAMMLQQSQGLFVTYKVKNTHATERRRVALHAGQFVSTDSIQKVLGDDVQAILGVVADSYVTVTNPEQIKEASKYFNAHPTRISRIEAVVDDAHKMSQFANDLHIKQYHPARGIVANVPVSFDLEIRSSSFQDNRATLTPNSQFDDQTLYFLTLEPGAEITLKCVLGAEINLAASLDKNFAAAVGE